MTPAAVKIELSGDDIEIAFADGTKQEIEAGRFQRKNTEGDTVEERAATAADLPGSTPSPPAPTPRGSRRRSCAPTAR